MNLEIKSLIEDNYILLGKIYFKIISKNNDNDLIELLKINEIILLELKYKSEFKDPDKVYRTLKKMYSNFLQIFEKL
jgi:hypothetical protein